MLRAKLIGICFHLTAWAYFMFFFMHAIYMWLIFTGIMTACGKLWTRSHHVVYIVIYVCIYVFLHTFHILMDKN